MLRSSAANCPHSSARVNTPMAFRRSSPLTWRTGARQPESRLGQRFLWQRKVASAENALPSVARHRVFGRRHGAQSRPRTAGGRPQPSARTRYGRQAIRRAVRRGRHTAGGHNRERAAQRAQHSAARRRLTATSIPQAQFHLWLEENGYLAPGEVSVEAAGKNWASEFNNLYVSPLIAKALLEVRPAISQQAKPKRARPSRPNSL